MLNLKSSVIFLLTVFTLASSTLASDEIDILQSRLVNDYLKGDCSNAINLLNSQSSDGSWTDIDYDHNAATIWNPINHLKRIRQMAIAYNKQAQTLYHNPGLLKAISNGLNFWYRRKPKSKNWWHNDIGQQLQLGPFLIMMEPYLSEEQINIGCTYLRNPYMTGQNLIWTALQTIQRGCLNESVDDINIGLDAMKNEVKITTHEAIQPDFSFYQHGPLLYSGGYGRSFLIDSVYWMYQTRGLSFGFSQEKIDIIASYLLDGTQWMVQGHYIDPSISGREISRPNATSWYSLVETIEKIKQLPTNRQQELSLLLKHINNSNTPNIVGDKHFWRTDYHVSRGPGYHASVNMASKRTLATEAINQENLLAYNLSFGTQFIMKTGDEYYNIFPVWDWTKLPGSTSPQNEKLPKMSNATRGTTEFVGGVSNSISGAACLDLNWNSVTAHKSWFFFPNRIVALGSEINSTSTNLIYTTVEQTYLKGRVYAGNKTKSPITLTQGEYSIPTPAWVFHNGIGYIFPDQGQINLSISPKSGSWKRINTPLSDQKITSDIFTLYIDHGQSPQDKEYSYIIYPNANLKQMQNLKEEYDIKIKSNSKDLQSVTFQATTAAIFYTPGQVELSNDSSLSISSPSAVIFNRNDNTIAVADPTQKLVTVKAIYKDNNSTKEIQIQLPKDANAGQTIMDKF